MNVVSWVGRLFGRASSERRAGEVRRQPSRDDLEDAHRAQVLEAVLPEVSAA
jgi:hypothetical protein